MTAAEMEQGNSYLVVYRRFNGRVNDEVPRAGQRAEARKLLRAVIA